MILDIGPRSVEHVVSVLARVKTLVWNGPFGAFELEPFDNGTIEVAEAAAELTAAGKLVTVAGGGDTVAALNAAGRDRAVHLCVDRGRRLPGVARRQDAAGCGDIEGEVIRPFAIARRDGKIPITFLERVPIRLHRKRAIDSYVVAFSAENRYPVFRKML